MSSTNCGLMRRIKPTSMLKTSLNFWLKIDVILSVVFFVDENYATLIQYSDCVLTDAMRYISIVLLDDMQWM